MLDKAARGVPVFDTAHHGEHYKAALFVYNIMEHGDDVPDFIVGAIMTALGEAARRQDMDVWLDVDGSDELERGGYSVQAMASLFSCSQFLSVNLEPKKDLAGLISAVLKHPDTPEAIYDAIRREVATMTEPNAVNEHPDVLRVALPVHKVESEAEADDEKGGA